MYTQWELWHHVPSYIGQIWDVYTMRIVASCAILHRSDMRCIHSKNCCIMCHPTSDVRCIHNENCCIMCHPTYSTLQVYQRSYSQVRHIPPKMSDKFESQHLVRLFGRIFWSDVRVEIKRFFLHFSRWICQTFCDRCVFVSVLSVRCVECAGT